MLRNLGRASPRIFQGAKTAADSVVNRHTGEIITSPTSTALMDTLSFSTYCEKLREYAREYLNVEILDPDKFWFNHKDKNNGTNCSK